MIDCVRSETARKYLKEKGIELDDKLKFALVVNDDHLYPQEDVVEYLEALITSTKDPEVREQAEKKIAYYHAQYAAFARDRGPGYYYHMTAFDRFYDRDEPIGDFRTLELAESFGRDYAREEGKEFTIELMFVAANAEEASWFTESGQDQRDGGRAKYNKEGKLLYCVCYSDELSERIEDPIENRWFPLPHPFRRGDILKSIYPINQDMRFIVTSCAGDDEIADQYKKQEWRFAAGLLPTWDCITFEVIPVNIRTGIVWDQDDPMYPYDFEYAEVSENYESVPDQMLIQMSKMVKGEPFSMQYIQNAQMKLHEEYDDSERYQLITGLKIKKCTIGKI